MRALPHTYRYIEAKVGTLINITVTGESGGEWLLKRWNDKWMFSEEQSAFTSQIEIPPAIAWKLFTKGIDKQAAERAIVFEGDQSLGKVVLNMVAVMG
jgi:hypothetical protein